MANRATIDEQIAHLKAGGVRFELMTEVQAREFLETRSYYFKVKAYRANYARLASDSVRSSGTYLDLDFGHLVELSNIDFSLSRLVLPITLAVEHALKVRVNTMLMRDPKEDLAELLVRQIGVPAVSGEGSIRANPYTKALVEHCGSRFDLWHLWELEPFSWHVRYYCRLHKYLEPDQEVPFEHLLFITRKLRNAVSHGNCLLADTTQKIPTKEKHGRTDLEVTRRALAMTDKPAKAHSGRSRTFQGALDRLVVNNYAAALLCHLEFVESPSVLEYTARHVLELRERIERRRETYFGDLGAATVRNRDVNETLEALNTLSSGYAKKARLKAARLAGSVRGGSNVAVAR